MKVRDCGLATRSHVHAEGPYTHTIVDGHNKMRRGQEPLH